MSHSSTSNSSPRGLFTWARLRREVARVILILLCLELLCRWEPVHNYLSRTLDSYQNLLWYDPRMPAYQHQLEGHPGYKLWLMGSSYVMTGLDPSAVQDGLEKQGFPGITTQNYGLDRMLNLEAMGQVVDRWMLALDQPRYAVIGIDQRNFTPIAAQGTVLQTSPYESMYIMPNSLNDIMTGFLYKNSLFYHYSVLARNALIIPADQAALQDFPRGGFVARSNVFQCDFNQPARSAATGNMESGLERLDRFIDSFRSRNIPVLVINIPFSMCTIVNSGYTSFADYTAKYLQPIAQHLSGENIPFVDLDSHFQAEVSPDDQHLYFADSAHPNETGAASFSQWTAEAVATWLKTLPPQD